MVRKEGDMKYNCPHCGKEFEETAPAYDGLGWYTACPECMGSFDIDPYEFLQSDPECAEFAKLWTDWFQKEFAEEILYGALGHCDQCDVDGWANIVRLAGHKVYWDAYLEVDSILSEDDIDTIGLSEEIVDYDAETQNKIMAVIKEHCKDADAFVNRPDDVCYIGEYDMEDLRDEDCDIENSGIWTRNDFIAACDGDEIKATELFGLCKWASPWTELDQWDEDDDVALEEMRSESAI